MKVSLLHRAEGELLDAVTYYNGESPGLGFDFAAECLRTIDRIVRNPLAWQKLSRRTRRALTTRFPYGIIYQVRSDEVLIVAVMHLHRHPASWKTN
jgi:plasmid stabilization system protein ParE